MKTILFILALIAASAAVYYFVFYKPGKINDRDGDYIPDEVEDTIKEVKRRAKNVKKELKDVKKSAKEFTSEIKDVAHAAKGGKLRKPRKPKAKK